MLRRRCRCFRLFGVCVTRLIRIVRRGQCRSGYGNRADHNRRSSQTLHSGRADEATNSQRQHKQTLQGYCVRAAPTPRPNVTPSVMRPTKRCVGANHARRPTCQRRFWAPRHPSVYCTISPIRVGGNDCPESASPTMRHRRVITIRRRRRG